MIREEQLTELGKVLKRHGIWGEVTIATPLELNPEDFSALFIEIQGNIIPFKIKQFRWNGSDGGILTLEDVNEQESQELVGNRCFVLTQEIVVDELEAVAFSLEGYQLFDEKAGYIGVIIDTDRQSHNVLFVVEKDDKTELLIPVAEEFFLKLDKEQQHLTLQLPEGLLDL